MARVARSFCVFCLDDNLLLAGQQDEEALMEDMFMSMMMENMMDGGKKGKGKKGKGPTEEEMFQ